MERTNTDLEEQDAPTSSLEDFGAQPPVDSEIPTAPVMPDVAPSRQNEDEKSKSKEARISFSTPGAYEVTKESDAPVMPDVAPSRQNEDENSKSKEERLSLSKPGAYEVTKKSEHTKLNLAPAIEREENGGVITTNSRMVELAPAVHDESPRSTAKGTKIRKTPATTPGAVPENAQSEKNKLALAAGSDPAMEEGPGAYSQTRGGSELEKKAEKAVKLNLAPAVPPAPTEQRPTAAMGSPRLRLAPAVDPGSLRSSNPNESSTDINPAEEPAQDGSVPPSADLSTANPSRNRQTDQQNADGGGLLQAEVAPDVQQLVADAVRQAMATNRDPSSRQNLVNEPSIALAEELADEEQPPQQVVDEEEQSAKSNDEKDESDESKDKILGMPKRFVLVALVAAIIAIIIAVASTSGGGETAVPTMAPSFSSDSQSLAPTAMPSLLSSSAPTSAQLLTYGETLLPGTNVYALDKESAEFRALEWIALEDGLNLDLASNELSERFRLAVLYLSTNGEKWIRNRNWMTDTSHCQWEFVACLFGNSVTHLLMEGNNLDGTLSTELFGLTNLMTLMLNKNERLRGTIPTKVGKLSALSVFTLLKNELTGTIPREIGQLSKVHLLSLSDNELTGAIPTELALVTGLKTLDLSFNPFLSPIPVEFTQLSQLIILKLGFCLLQGSIPTEFGLLTNLANLYMFGNSLEGPIPSEIGNMSTLGTLDLRDNILSGSIPTEIGKLTAMTSMRLRNNFFEGPIPSEIGNLSMLNWLDMQDIGLVGAIPSEVGRLTGLTQLNLAINELRGKVPSELNQLTNAHTVELYANNLTDGLEITFCNQTMEFFGADCLEPAPEVVCGCCTHCCGSENGECFQEGEER